MDDSAHLTFEAAFAQLEETLAQLETDSLPLERAITLYQRGGELARHCQSLLDAAEQRLEVLESATSEEPNAGQVPPELPLDIDTDDSPY